jgi:hypothetical protein
VAVCGLGLESVTLILMANDPDWVGVPAREPVEENVTPAGSWPEEMPSTPS